MKDFANPPPDITYLIIAATQQLDQLHDRLFCELKYHERSLADGPEPTVQLALEEVRIAVCNLNRTTRLLLLISEDAI